MRMRSTCVGNTPCLVAVLLVGAAGSVPARAETPAPPLSSIRVTGDARVTATPHSVQIDGGATTRASPSHQAAAGLGLKVVRILSVEESSPRVVPVRAFMGGAVRTAAAPATPVESGTLDVTADVVLTVEVSPAAH